MKTATNILEAYAIIRKAGLTPIPMEWYLKRCIPVSGVSSVETYGPSFYLHPKLYVPIVENENPLHGGE